MRTISLLRPFQYTKSPYPVMHENRPERSITFIASHHIPGKKKYIARSRTKQFSKLQKTEKRRPFIPTRSAHKIAAFLPPISLFPNIHTHK
ncbi:hypothetical protein EUGRSUZ_B02076 [Eucalyptus grandis]|uniref:Uncharacterized protein n=2 Tax=Eucalyptus grandis TaxID=71139 RepID=A0ACC3LRD0_EUCGR|nr:hypothetical protein EUGRSUZ_B02076 [Eucalyptus grandis]